MLGFAACGATASRSGGDLVWDPKSSEICLEQEFVSDLGQAMACVWMGPPRFVAVDVGPSHAAVTPRQTPLRWPESCVGKPGQAQFGQPLPKTQCALLGGAARWHLLGTQRACAVPGGLCGRAGGSAAVPAPASGSPARTEHHIPGKKISHLSLCKAADNAPREREQPG